MSPRHASSGPRISAATRLRALAPLDARELAALSAAEASARRLAAQSEILMEGQPVAEASILLAGWACRSRAFSDGRRQILSLLLPGDLIGSCLLNAPTAATGVTALTSVVLCPAPSPEAGQAGLIEAYARSWALEELYLFRQIGRLGRLSAYERIVDLLLELRERLSAVGLASADSFPLPLTQEMLADMLGLTSVHVNRMLQMLRREGLLELREGIAHLQNAAQLAERAGHRLARVFAERQPERQGDSR